MFISFVLFFSFSHPFPLGEGLGEALFPNSLRYCVARPSFAKRGSHFCAHTNWPVLPAFSSTLQTHIHAQEHPTARSRAHSELPLAL